MVAGLPLTPLTPAAPQPPANRKGLQQMFVRAPGDDIRRLFGPLISIAHDFPRDGEVGLGRLNGNRHDFPVHEARRANNARPQNWFTTCEKPLDSAVARLRK